MFNLIKKLFNKNKVHELKFKEIDFSDLVQIIKEEKYGKSSEDYKFDVEMLREHSIVTFDEFLKQALIEAEVEVCERDFVDTCGSAPGASWYIPSKYFIDEAEKHDYFKLSEEQIRESWNKAPKHVRENIISEKVFYSNPNFRCGKIEEKEEDQS